jgi:hypothetical protein
MLAVETDAAQSEEALEILNGTGIAEVGVVHFGVVMDDGLPAP